METRVRVVAALCEGNSIRATARIVGVDKNAVMDLALRVGEGCAHLHNRLVRGIAAHVVQCDETWSFVAKKEARVDPEKDPAEWGDIYTFLALDSVTKLLLAFEVGKRDQAHTDRFITDLRARLTVVPHITTDGFSPYESAIASSFAGVADYGVVVKNYRVGSSRGPDHRYEPPRDPFITKRPVQGVPNMATLSTSHVERVNLTMRHVVGRTRRLCLAFSRTARGHRAAMSLGVMAYNFTRIHSTIEATPAMEARLAVRPWTILELVEAALAEQLSERPAARALALPAQPQRATPARELPNGRGFLRMVGGGSSSGGPSPVPAPMPPPVADAPHATPPDAEPLETPSAQLSLLEWRPRPKPAGQLSLFGEE